ncbi:MAG: Ig-like domain-containing protein, partial [Nitrosopumilaceae archaeon]
LVAEPLIEKVLSNTDFPLVLYLSDGEEVTYFPEDSTLSIPPSEFVHVEPKTINKGQSITLLDSKSLKAGSVTLSVEAGDFTASTLIDNLASKPAMIHLDYPDPLLTNVENTFSIQVLDGQELPVFATQDIEMKFVLNDQLVISVPESVTIKKGDYYTLFDVEANAVGQTELSVLASDLPLSKFVIGVEKVLPEITISSPDYVNPNTNFDLTITVQQANSPLSNMNVEWSVQGAEIQNMESVTDENGIARISLFSQDPTKVDVQASVSGGLFPSSVVSKQVNVNIPLESTASSSGLPMLNIGINPIFIIIPVAAAVGGIIVLKKKNMLSGLTEKISVIE